MTIDIKHTLIDRWNVVAVDGRITDPYLAPRITGATPAPGHIPTVDGRIFAYADGYDTPEEAVQALTQYLATVNRPRSWAPPTERNHLT